jgi:three-Cys-motif partner protein
MEAARNFLQVHAPIAVCIDADTMAEKFFDEREDQSEVKARIVSKYFGAWAKIIGPISTAERIGYIDLFCGPGRYKDGSKSTPLMVLEQAVGNDLMRQRLVTMFNDQDPDHTKNLNDEIAKIAGIETLKFAPAIYNDVVGDEMTAKLNSISLIPSFSFIDPFGYKGLSLGLVQAAIKSWGCDCVFFFNYNRINAGITNPVVDTHIKALFGEQRANELKAAVVGKTPIQREALVLEHLVAAIRELGGKFVLPFRFRNANGTRSTHHLMFVTKHVLGYEIMKEIMAKESSTHDQGVPSFEYSPADANTPFLFSLLKPLEGLVNELADKFAGRTLTMIDVYNEHHVDTPFIKKNYKVALLKLEAANRIQATSAKKRRKGTFADDVVVTFPAKNGVT